MQGPTVSVFKARSNRHDKEIIEAVHRAVAMAVGLESFKTRGNGLDKS